MPGAAKRQSHKKRYQVLRDCFVTLFLAMTNKSAITRKCPNTTLGTMCCNLADRFSPLKHLLNLTPSQLALVLANLIPLFGVLYLDWDVGSIVVLYWLENLVIGGYTILKMLLAGKFGALFNILFFIVHYGGFCAVHGMFVLQLTAFGAGETEVASETSWPGPLVLVGMFLNLGRQLLAAAPEHVIWVIIAMVLSHGVSFALNFIGQGEYKSSRVRQLMTAPYKRIAVLHIAIIAGAFLVKQLGSPLGLLLALVALKIGLDIMLHNRSHRSARPDTRAEAA